MEMRSRLRLARGKYALHDYSLMNQTADGILLIDKDAGETSFDVVRKVKSALVRGGTQKVGHAGTLDPFATGLLIILLGQGTKLSPFLMESSKLYLATIRLGIETDTLDPTGRVISVRPVPKLSRKKIEREATQFVGQIEQIPPMYSAVRHQGVRAYRLARKGLNPQLKKRKVMVHSLEILSVDLPRVTFKLKCSSGTYVRSIASELGRKLGTGGHLRSLRRLSSGPFEVKDALPSGEITGRSPHSILGGNIIPLRAALPDMAEIKIDAGLAKRVRQGYQPCWEEVAGGVPEHDYDGEGFVKLVADDELVAILKLRGKKRGGPGVVRIKRVFS